jgi:lipopolysaccharide/colanic/teichoic acid biosynthesis glycosyltransferase
MGKRFFDIVFSFFFLVLGSPFFLVCMIAVKASSQGPIFYAHSRVGRNGKMFGCWKFRTMIQNADAQLQLLLSANPELMHEWATYFKLKEDPRITAIGKFLRKTSLDELPQVWNVFVGDMSVVGPRPLTQHEVTQYVQGRADQILSLRPGLTTLWIVEGRNLFTIQQRVELETEYVKNRSFWLDCKLIVKTALIMIFPKGAY